MDISFHPSIPPSRPMSPFTISHSLTIPPSTSPKSDWLHTTSMRRTLSAAHLPPSPATSASGSLALEDAISLRSALIHSLPPISAETSSKHQSATASAHAYGPASAAPNHRAQGPDEDDYAWYFRNPHRYIRRPTRPDALRYIKRNCRSVLTGAESQRYGGRNGDGDGSDVNMRLFAAYLERHYAATPLSASATYTGESEPTRAHAGAAHAQATMGMDGDRSSARDYDRARKQQDDGRSSVTGAMARSDDDDGASTIFSACASISVDDWDAPTLTNGSLPRNSALSCDAGSAAAVPCSAAAAALSGSSYVDVGGAALQGSNSPKKLSLAFSPSLWDFGSPSKLIGASYVEVVAPNRRDCEAPIDRPRNGRDRGHDDGAEDSDDTRSASISQPTSGSKHIHRKDRAVPQAQRFSFLRLFSS